VAEARKSTALQSLLRFAITLGYCWGNGLVFELRRDVDRIVAVDHDSTPLDPAVRGLSDITHLPVTCSSCPASRQ
jgi:hypothetical protein